MMFDVLYKIIAGKQKMTHQKVSEALRNLFLRPDLKDGSPAKLGIMEAIALEGLLFAELGAMVGYIYINHIVLEGDLLAIHFAVAAVPLIGLVAMYFLRSNAMEKTPAHDRSTIMFLRWSIPACCVMIFLITYAGMAGTWSGKPLPMRLPIVYTHIDKWQKETNKHVAKNDRIVEAYAALTPPRGASLPGNTLVVRTMLSSNAIDDSWEIIGTGSFIGGVESKDNTSFSNYDDKTHQHLLIVDNYDFTKLYTIKVVLRQKSPIITPDNVVKLIEADGVVNNGILNVTAHYFLQEYQ